MNIWGVKTHSTSGEHWPVSEWGLPYPYRQRRDRGSRAELESVFHPTRNFSLRVCSVRSHFTWAPAADPAEAHLRQCCRDAWTRPLRGPRVPRSRGSHVALATLMTRVESQGTWGGSRLPSWHTLERGASHSGVRPVPSHGDHPPSSLTGGTWGARAPGPGHRTWALSSEGAPTPGSRRLPDPQPTWGSEAPHCPLVMGKATSVHPGPARGTELSEVKGQPQGPQRQWVLMEGGGGGWGGYRGSMNTGCAPRAPGLLRGAGPASRSHRRKPTASPLRTHQPHHTLTAGRTVAPAKHTARQEPKRAETGSLQLWLRWGSRGGLRSPWGGA